MTPSLSALSPHPMKGLKNAESQLLWWDVGNCLSGDFSHCTLASLFVEVGLLYYYFCFNYCMVFRKNSYLLFSHFPHMSCMCRTLWARPQLV